MRDFVLALACQLVVLFHNVNYLLQENVTVNAVFYMVKRCFKRFIASKKPGAETPDK